MSICPDDYMDHGLPFADGAAIPLFILIFKNILEVISLLCNICLQMLYYKDIPKIYESKPTGIVDWNKKQFPQSNLQLHGINDKN